MRNRAWTELEYLAQRLAEFETDRLGVLMVEYFENLRDQAVAVGMAEATQDRETNIAKGKVWAFHKATRFLKELREVVERDMRRIERNRKEEEGDSNG